jgi:hypothetical protein
VHSHGGTVPPWRRTKPFGPVLFAVSETSSQPGIMPPSRQIRIDGIAQVIVQAHPVASLVVIEAGCCPVAWMLKPRSIMLTMGCACAWGCVPPPMSPNGPHWPRRSSRQEDSPVRRQVSLREHRLVGNCGTIAWIPPASGRHRSPVSRLPPSAAPGRSVPRKTSSSACRPPRNEDRDFLGIITFRMDQKTGRRSLIILMPL